MYFPLSKQTRRFMAQAKTTTTDAKGRMVPTWNDTVPFKGFLADSTAEQIERWSQTQHPVTHTIVAKGQPMAKEDERLKMDGRLFYIQRIENPGGYNLWTLYHCEERKDA
jgi:SPP1 family predicted phage head-tail adaptor